MTKGPRVLHAAQPVEAGVARCVVQLATEQVARGWSVTVACPDGWLAVEAARVGATVRPWAAARAPGPTVPAEVARLRRIVGDDDPEVVHLHSAKAGLAGRLAIRGRWPTMYQPHAWSFDAARAPLSTLALTWERAAARWADLIVCVSAAERDHGIARGVHGRYAVAANGVDLAGFPPGDAEARQNARADLGIEDAPTVVCLGRLSRQKGQDVAIAAWPLVRALVPDARLYLVGDGSLPKLAGHLPPGVTLAGPTDRPRTWLTAADVVAVPSRWEGQPLVVLEAMACGRPVVGSNVSGIAESLGLADIDTESRAGAVVRPNDPRALAHELSLRLTRLDLSESEGKAASSYAAVHHDLSHTLSRSLELAANVAARTTTTPCQ